jgi:tetratricopeptide (TPR) repeat protein
LPLEKGGKSRKKSEERKGGSSASDFTPQTHEAERFVAKEKLGQLHTKARESFEQSKYREAFDAYVEYGDSMSKVKGLAGAEAAIVEGAHKFEQIMFWYEAGNLYLMVANFLSNKGALPDAGDFYLRAAEALEKSKESDLRGIITGAYAAAAHALREAKSPAESERAVVKGVIYASGENPLEIEGSALRLLKTGNFRGASDAFEKAALTYQKAIDALSDMSSAIESGQQAIDVKSMLHHRVAQSLLASAAALLKSNDKASAIRKNAEKAADEYTNAVINFTPLFSVGEPDKEDCRRYTYDLMMGTALRLALSSTEDIETLKEQLTYVRKKPPKHLEESKYLEIAQTLMKKGKISSILDELKEVSLGNIEQAKNHIIELLSKGR